MEPVCQTDEQTLAFEQGAALASGLDYARYFRHSNLHVLEQRQALREVVQKVTSKLSSGHFDPVSVAREPGISPSTLQRHLAAKGVLIHAIAQ